MTFNPYRSRSLLFKCLFVSLSVHAAALCYFYFNPFILHNPFPSFFGLSSSEPLVLEEEKEELLTNHFIEEVFEKILVLPPHLRKPCDLMELPKGIGLAPNQELAAELPFHIESGYVFTTPRGEYASVVEELEEDSQEWNAPNLFHPPELGAPIASQLQIDAKEVHLDLPLTALAERGDDETDLKMGSDLVLEMDAPDTHPVRVSGGDKCPVSSKPGEAVHIKADPKTALARVQENATLAPEETLEPPLFIPKPSARLGRQEVALANYRLDEYDFSDLNAPGTWSDDFDVDVTFLPHPKGKGYIFSLAMKSNYDLSSHSLKQNIYFVLDRSNSIQKHRFGIFKRATLKALSSMQKGDTFNILVVDKKITRFSPQSCAVNLKNIQSAERFLDKQESGGFFEFADVYTSIDKLLEFVPQDQEQHTAILLTDGKTSMNAERKQSLLKKWMTKNRGKMALYACAIGADNDLFSLDMLCHCSGGKLLYSDTHASFPRKLAKLMLDLKDPIANNLKITAIPENPYAHVTLYPSGCLSTLYGNQPYVIVGEIDEPGAFDFVVQGKHRDEWIEIRKNVSFIDGHKGDSALESKWEAEHANLCYEKFLDDGLAKHLKEAKQILKTHRSEVAFE